ncbi:MAG: MFS transporter [Lentisphaeria bacterium]|nr:MFS transporter [Lentisphaeria bacterium]
MIKDHKTLKFSRYDYAGFSGYIAYACCAMVLSIVLIPLGSELHFSQSMGGALHLARSIAMLLTMVAAALFIRKAEWLPRTLGVALFLIGAGILLAGFSASYAFLLGMILLSALGQGLFEVLITPEVRLNHKQEDAGRYVNITHAFWPAGVVGMVLLGCMALTLGVSWRLILICSGALALLPGVLFLLPGRELQPQTGQAPSEKINLQDVRTVLGKKRFWIFLFCMFLAGGAEHCLSFWVPSFIKLEFGQSGFFCGLGTAIFAVGMFLGRLYSGIFGSAERMRKTILFSAGAGLLTGLFPAVISNLPVLYAVLFLLGFFTGPLWPSIQNLCISEIKEHPMTILMLLPCIGIPGCGFFTCLMGIAADVFGVRNSFLLAPVCFLALAGAILLDSRLHNKNSD